MGGGGGSELRLEHAHSFHAPPKANTREALNIVTSLVSRHPYSILSLLLPPPSPPTPNSLLTPYPLLVLFWQSTYQQSL